MPCLGNSSDCMCLGRERKGSREICDQRDWEWRVSRTGNLELQRGSVPGGEAEGSAVTGQHCFPPRPHSPLATTGLAG